jgi:hypothetical protein
VSLSSKYIFLLVIFLVIRYAENMPETQESNPQLVLEFCNVNGALFVLVKSWLSSSGRVGWLSRDGQSFS